MNLQQHNVIESMPKNSDTEQIGEPVLPLLGFVKLLPTKQKTSILTSRKPAPDLKFIATK